MSIKEIRERHDRVASGTGWDFTFSNGRLANRDRGILIDRLDAAEKLCAYKEKQIMKERKRRNKAETKLKLLVIGVGCDGADK